MGIRPLLCVQETWVMKKSASKHPMWVKRDLRREVWSRFSNGFTAACFIESVNVCIVNVYWELLRTLLHTPQTSLRYHPLLGDLRSHSHFPAETWSNWHIPTTYSAKKEWLKRSGEYSQLEASTAFHGLAGTETSGWKCFIQLDPTSPSWKRAYSQRSQPQRRSRPASGLAKLKFQSGVSLDISSLLERQCYDCIRFYN